VDGHCSLNPQQQLYWHVHTTVHTSPSIKPPPNPSLNNLHHNPRPNHYPTPLKTLRIPNLRILSGVRKIRIIPHPKMQSSVSDSHISHPDALPLVSQKCQRKVPCPRLVGIPQTQKPLDASSHSIIPVFLVFHRKRRKCSSKKIWIKPRVVSPPIRIRVYEYGAMYWRRRGV